MLGSTLSDWFAGNRLPSKAKLERLARSIGATRAEGTELEAARERLVWAARADNSERQVLSILDALEPDADRHVVQQLAAVLLQSAEQRDRAAAVRTVGPQAVLTAYSTPRAANARHRGPEQPGHEQAELEALAKRVAEIVSQREIERAHPTSLPRWIIQPNGHPRRL